MDEPVQNRFDATEYAERLETYKAELYFPALQPPKDIEDILNKTNSQAALRALGPELCSEYAIVLQSYALFLTIQEARMTSFVNWCEGNIKHIVGRELNNVPPEVGTYFPSRDAYIRANEKTAVELENRKSVAELKLNSIKFLSQRIQYVADSLKNLSYEKRKRLRDRE